MPFVANFLPSINGLHFLNGWPQGTPPIVVNLPFGKVPIGDAANGMCGGMCFTVQDCFVAGRNPPPDTVPPPAGSRLLTYIMDRLLDSWDIPAGATTYWVWAGTADHDIGVPPLVKPGLARMTIIDQIPQITSSIDQGQLCTLGLVTVHSANPDDLKECHQVVAYGYEWHGTHIRFSVYDPNRPDDDSTFIGLDTADPAHTTTFDTNVGGVTPIRIRGFFFTQYTPVDPTPIIGAPLPLVECAFQANTGNLFTYSSDAGPADLQQGMKDGTSPSIGALPGGGYQMAFQSNTGNLIVFGDVDQLDTGQGMRDGTSPAIAVAPDGSYRVAFQANTGNLFTYSSDAGPADLQQGMKDGTSPSIGALPGGGYQMAFQSNTGNLIVFGDVDQLDTGQGMRDGTSPAIAVPPDGSYRVAFQANTGNLFTYSSDAGPADLQQGMKDGTSPSIGALPGGGYQMAFQSNTGNLIVFGDVVQLDTGQGMRDGTSPAIAVPPHGSYRVAFQANTGNLFTYSSDAGPADLQQGMKDGTSPSVA